MKITQKPSKYVYTQLEDDLRTQIQEGVFDCNRPLAGEKELVEKYNISRQSVRKALHALEKEGLILRKRGKGTFVVPPEDRAKGIERKNLTILFMAAWLEKGISEYERSFLEGAAEYSFRAGHKVSYASSSQYNCSNLLKDFQTGKFDAIVWVSFSWPCDNVLRDLHVFRDAGIPQLIINRQINGFPCLKINNHETLTRIVNYLHDCGHTEIGFINCDRTTTVYEEREEGFFNAMQNNSFEDPGRYYLRMSNIDIEKGFQKIEKFVTATSALILGGFSYLAPFLNLAEKMNLKIPEQISLICINDSFVAKTYKTPISVYTESRFEVGKQAVHCVEALVREQLLDNEVIVLKGDLIIRNSCKIVR